MGFLQVVQHSHSGRPVSPLHRGQLGNWASGDHFEAAAPIHLHYRPTVGFDLTWKNVTTQVRMAGNSFEVFFPFPQVSLGFMRRTIWRTDCGRASREPWTGQYC
jgi:hypothetical protein